MSSDSISISAAVAFVEEVGLLIEAGNEACLARRKQDFTPSSYIDSANDNLVAEYRGRSNPHHARRFDAPNQ